jgi:hypothetical protein
MKKILMIQRVRALLLRALDALCDRYANGPSWTDKLFLS